MKSYNNIYALPIFLISLFTTSLMIAPLMGSGNADMYKNRAELSRLLRDINKNAQRAKELIDENRGLINTLNKSQLDLGLYDRSLLYECVLHNIDDAGFFLIKNGAYLGTDYDLFPLAVKNKLEKTVTALADKIAALEPNPGFNLLRGEYDHRNALHYAVEWGSLPMVKRIVELEVKLRNDNDLKPSKKGWLRLQNMPDNSDNTPLHYALTSRAGSQPSTDEVQAKITRYTIPHIQDIQAKIASYLIQQDGTDIRLQNGKKLTPLYLAVEAGNRQITELLVNKHKELANKDDASENDKNWLHQELGSQGQTESVEKALIRLYQTDPSRYQPLFSLLDITVPKIDKKSHQHQVRSSVFPIVGVAALITTAIFMLRYFKNKNAAFAQLKKKLADLQEAFASQRIDQTTYNQELDKLAQEYSQADINKATQNIAMTGA